MRHLAEFHWYHCIALPDGRVTPGHESLLPFQAPVLDVIHAHDLHGKHVLDIGCRDGLFSLACEQQGAASVTGIDNDLSIGAVEMLLPMLGSRIQMRQQNVYDLSDGMFDFVVFAGVLYHLRFPDLAIHRIAQRMPVGATLLVETGAMLWPMLHPFIYAPAPEDSPWDPTSVVFYNPPALVATMCSLGFTNPRLHSIITGSHVTRYDSLQAFAANIDRYVSGDTPFLGRILYTFERRAPNATDELTAPYWFDTHNLNSFSARAAQI